MGRQKGNYHKRIIPLPAVFFLPFSVLEIQNSRLVKEERGCSAKNRFSEPVGQTQQMVNTGK